MLILFFWKGNFLGFLEQKWRFLVLEVWDQFVKITLDPQLDQGNEEVIRVALLTFGLKR
jgi:hypothetical protein